MRQIKSKKAFDVDKNTSLLISILLFGTSACFSVLLLITQGSTLMAQILFGILAVALEMGKFHYPTMGFTRKDYHIIARICYVLLGVTIMYFSLRTSFSFSKNESISIENAHYENSDELKAANKAITTRDSLIKRLEGEIAGLKADKKNELAVLDPVNYRSKREKITERYNKEITKKSDKLTEQQSVATKVDSKDIKTVKKIDKGLTAGFKNKAEENNFFAFVSIVLEIAGIAAYVDYKKKRFKVLRTYTVCEDEETDQDQEDNPNDGKVIDIDSKTKADRSIDLETPQNASKGVYLGKATDSARNETPATPDTAQECEYSREDIEEYLRYVYKSTATGKACNGQNLIKDNTNLKLEQIKAIRYHLKKLGIVEINNKTNRTFLLIESLDEVLRQI